MEGGAPATPGQRRGKGVGSQEFAPPAAQLIAHYFALDHPLAEICASFPGRSGNECGARFLLRFANHSPAEMGMSGYVHLFVDETGGTYSSDLARAPATLW